MTLVGEDPIELLLIAIPAIWYAMGVRRLWRRAGVGRGVSPAQAIAFAAGLATLLVVLSEPFDAMADALFSAHMVQHLLLILVAAPLCVAGVPAPPMLMALPRASRLATGRWWNRRPFVRGVIHFLTNPGLAFVAQMLALWFWHLPVPYQMALRHPAMHALEHLSFFGTGFLFWWVVATPVGRRRAKEGTAILMVAGTLMQSGVLGALLMFASSPWYPAHAAGARAWGTTPLEDQQLAGLIMWIPASLVYVAAAAWLFMRWMRDDERLEAARTGAASIFGIPKRLADTR